MIVIYVGVTFVGVRVELICEGHRRLSRLHFDVLQLADKVCTHTESDGEQ